MRFIELERVYELAFLEKNISTPADFLIFVLHYSLQMFDMKHISLKIVSLRRPAIKTAGETGRWELWQTFFALLR